MKIFFFITLLVVVLAEVDNTTQEDKRSFEIFTLNNNFYGNFIDHEDMVFVKYYAPWCGHCKALKPVYENLAKELYNKLKFAEVNCEESKEICEKEGIEGYPTLILFRKGRSKKVYGGERNVEAMKKFLENESLPPIIESTKEAIEELKKKENSFVIIKSEADDQIRNKLVELVDELDYLHFYALNTEMDNFELSVYNGDSKELFTYEITTLDKFNGTEFIDWANSKTFPLFHQVNMPLFRRIENLPVYTLWYFYQGTIPKVHEDLFRGLAKKYNGKFIFFSFNKVISEDQVKHMHHTGNVYPVISVIHTNKRNMYVMDEEATIDEETINKYIESILNGTAQLYYQLSDPIKPEDQKDVFKLTGHNFNEFVTTKGKDSLIIFCVERADMCKYFLTTPLAKVAKRMQGIDTFQMAWIDASTDDVSPEWNLNIIPKIYLVSEKNGETKKVEMNEMPSEENTMKFIMENALFKFEMPAPLPEEKKEEEVPESDSDSEEVEKPKEKKEL
ncbi:thioredoxin, putative [Entamoeba histolytica HM-1:IMSS-B]|uniref:protein disulfide-isomerase n=6 Tax=Entamoeba histolytica TaxID=5759 RepID=C4LU87_ENTH1|nr:thioredoxin, putative [Entamoeba histolytica HM-1:IMSS]EMD43928.1 protein disulfideisomerase precursor, putative [Entamoeba histolytica KU27]EMH74772.1 thioredoxin, putative [Entamoeba histolytica HM-1:IMSS-B]EMS14448.1 protein disulfide-isomerase precursor, putative [Entamoeba histolytica HM-3:IMSS]ENY61339.1 thioredoxin, putative [Entamoeba histolytica HM-1:IMSS-A]GAT92161.1 thioredoxin putative [Entamoeba histolytica]|eukprot:XP_657045.2 thioredoxin, putative [Entamoeba histolytica HM-1:IMSS]